MMKEKIIVFYAALWLLSPYIVAASGDGTEHQREEVNGLVFHDNHHQPYKPDLAEWAKPASSSQECAIDRGFVTTREHRNAEGKISIRKSAVFSWRNNFENEAQKPFTLPGGAEETVSFLSDGSITRYVQIKLGEDGKSIAIPINLPASRSSPVELKSEGYFVVYLPYDHRAPLKSPDLACLEEEETEALVTMPKLDLQKTRKLASLNTTSSLKTTLSGTNDDHTRFTVRFEAGSAPEVIIINRPFSFVCVKDDRAIFSGWINDPTADTAFIRLLEKLEKRKVAGCWFERYQVNQKKITHWTLGSSPRDTAA